MDMGEKSESEHVLELSSEILEDIELSHLSADKLLLKSSRLARLAGSEEINKWIKFEMNGYNSSDPVSLSYMAKTGRWVDRENMRGYWAPLAEQEESIAAKKAQLAVSKIDSLSGEWALATSTNIFKAQTALTRNISTLTGIVSVRRSLWLSYAEHTAKAVVRRSY